MYTSNMVGTASVQLSYKDMYLAGEYYHTLSASKLSVN